MTKADDYEENQQRAPVIVPAEDAHSEFALTIPWHLVKMAHAYPAIDWNAAMRYAVESATEQGRL